VSGGRVRGPALLTTYMMHTTTTTTTITTLHTHTCPVPVESSGYASRFLVGRKSTIEPFRYPEMPGSLSLSLSLSLCLALVRSFRSPLPGNGKDGNQAGTQQPDKGRPASSSHARFLGTEVCCWLLLYREQVEMDQESDWIHHSDPGRQGRLDSSSLGPHLHISLSPSLSRARGVFLMATTTITGWWWLTILMPVMSVLCDDGKWSGATHPRFFPHLRTHARKQAEKTDGQCGPGSLEPPPPPPSFGLARGGKDRVPGPSRRRCDSISSILPNALRHW